MLLLPPLGLVTIPVGKPLPPLLPCQRVSPPAFAAWQEPYDFAIGVGVGGTGVLVVPGACPLWLWSDVMSRRGAARVLSVWARASSSR